MNKPDVASHLEYLEKLPKSQRETLEQLSKAIRSIVPTAQECISYHIPAYRLNGKVLVLFGATAKHCSFYPGSGTAVEAFKNDLKKYRTSKGTIHFSETEPLSLDLVRKIVQYRVAENENTQGAKTSEKRHD